MRPNFFGNKKKNLFFSFNLKPGLGKKKVFFGTELAGFGGGGRKIFFFWVGGTFFYFGGKKEKKNFLF